LGALVEIPWLLLIYTLPAEPSRKRAFIWRELKKVGAPYLRDGVCILPERSDTLASAGVIAAKVEEFGGEATLVSGARLSPSRSAPLVEQFKAARAQEYAELEELEADLGKLRRWTGQVVARDYFGDGTPPTLRDVLDRCERALATFLDTAEAQDRAAR
jgi:hypothetical protein